MDNPCRFCGEVHQTPRCPHVRALEYAYNPMGQLYVSRIEFFPTEESKADYPKLRPLE